MKLKEIKWEVQFSGDMQDGGYFWQYESVNFPQQLRLVTLVEKKGAPEQKFFRVVGEDPTFPTLEEFKAELLQRGWIEPDEVEGAHVR